MCRIWAMTARARAAPIPRPAVMIWSRRRRSSGFSPAAAAAALASHGVTVPPGISCGRSRRVALAPRRWLMSRVVSVSAVGCSDITGLRDVADGGGFERRGDGQCSVGAGGGHAVSGVEVVVAVDDLLEAGAGAE